MFAFRQAKGSLRNQINLVHSGANRFSIDRRSFRVDQVVWNNGESNRTVGSETPSEREDTNSSDTHQFGNGDNHEQNGVRFEQVESESKIEPDETQNANGTAEKVATRYLDTFLSDESAFERDEGVTRMSRPDQINRRAEAELNQGWGDLSVTETRGNEKRRLENTLKRNMSEKRKRGANPYDGPLTKPEKQAFGGIFDGIFRSDHDSNGNENSSFGTFRTSTDRQRMENFHRKNIYKKQGLEGLPLVEGAGRMSDFKTEVKARSPSRADRVGLVRELFAEGEKNESQILQGFDKAKTEINACQSPFAIWQWAQENVWGQTRRNASIQAGITSNSDEEESYAAEQTATDARSALKDSIFTSSEPRFGITSPFYAPVLRQLMIELRQRFRSPHSALNILHVTKSAGSESVVLGCTPALYAEAIRTSWQAFGDLADIVRLVEDAKLTGALSSGRKQRSFLKRPSDQERSPDEWMDNLHDDSIIRSLLSNIQKEAQDTTWNALAKINELQRSQGIYQSSESDWQGNMENIPLSLQERFSTLSKLRQYLAPAHRKQKERSLR